MALSIECDLRRHGECPDTACTCDCHPKSRHPLYCPPPSQRARRAEELLRRLVEALDPARDIHYRDALELRERALAEARAHLEESDG